MLDPAIAARARLLMGVAAHALSDKTTAWAGFRQARIFDPDLAWESGFSLDARPIFDAAGAELANTSARSLVVVPPPMAVALHIDGRPATPDPDGIALVPGSHLVQLGEQQQLTLEVEVGADLDSTLVIPAAVPPEAVSWPADAELRPALEAVLTSALDRGTIAWFAIGESVWRFEIGSGAWELFATSGERLPLLARIRWGAALGDLLTASARGTS